jgi:U3 small nucleolar RNA-associated protein 21
MNRIKYTDKKAVELLRKMSPAAIDFELRSLSLKNDFQELKSVLRMIQHELQTGENFELIEAILKVFLQVGNILSSNTYIYI